MNIDIDINKIGSQVMKFGESFMGSTQKSLENRKVDSQIKELQNELDDAYRILGYRVYTKLKESSAKSKKISADDYHDLLQEIDDKSAGIAGHLEKKTVSSKRVCVHCEKEIPDESLFCPYCGKENQK